MPLVSILELLDPSKAKKRKADAALEDPSSPSPVWMQAPEVSAEASSEDASCGHHNTSELQKSNPKILDFMPKPKKFRKRTVAECYEIIPPDHPAWWIQDSQCLEGCDCLVCEVTNTLIEDVWHSCSFLFFWCQRCVNPHYEDTAMIATCTLHVEWNDKWNCWLLPAARWCYSLV